MKLLTILVDNRTDHVLNFDANSPVANSYVLPNMSKAMSLFAFYRSENVDERGITIQTDNGEERAILTSLEVLPEETTGNERKIKIKPILKYGDSIKNESHLQKNEYWNPDRLSVKYKTEQDIEYTIEVEFTIFHDAQPDVKDTASVILNVVSESQIYDVVLDYGSESSQMLVVNRKDTATVANIIPLFTLFKRSCSENDGRDAHCLQYDMDSDKGTMMKSVFFVNKTPDPVEMSIYKPIINDNAVHFITDVNNLDNLGNTHFIMPNIKIAGFGGVSLPMVEDNGIPVAVNLFRDNYFYRRTVNAYLYQAMRYIANDERPAYINLCLLTPNIYRQEQVTRNLYDACVAVKEMANHNDEVKLIKGVEVSSVSESDASLLGFINTLPATARNSMGKGRYLILDAGKGTLDFSVLDYQPESPEKAFSSIFRAGLIGAGNALTYSFFLSLMTYIYKSYWHDVPEHKMMADIAAFVSSKMTAPSVDSAVLSKVMRNLEKYKVMYSNGSLRRDVSVSFSPAESFDKFSLVALNNCLDQLVQKECHINDLSHVNNMMATLAHEAAVKFKLSYNKDDVDSEIKYIVFAGRTFQMEQFRNQVIASFKEKNDKVCEKMIEKSLSLYGDDSGATYKNRCLFILELLRAGRYNGKLVGVPKMLRYSNNREYTLEDEVSAATNNPAAADAALPSFVQSIVDGVKNGWKLILDAVLVDSDEDSVYVDNNMSDPSNRLSRELVKGFEVYINSLADMIIISGVAYPLPNGMNSKEQASVFFNGDHFEIRQKDGRVGRLIPPPSLSASHVFESMFPYSVHPNGKPLPVPRASTDGYDPVTDSYDISGNEVDATGSYGKDDEKLLKQLES